MKKIAAILLVLCLVIALVGCGQTSEDPNDGVTEPDATDDVVAETTDPGQDVATEEIAFPEKPIQITVPWSAGGLADVIARQLAEVLPDYLGQPVVVTNKTGAAGTLAVSEYLQEEPDGYSLMLVSSPLICFQPFAREVSYSWDDFAPIIGLNEVKSCMLSNPSKSGIETIDDLKEVAKTRKIMFGYAGPGAFDGVYPIALLEEMGIDYETVTYSDAISIMNALLNGDVDICANNAGNFEEHVKAGNLAAWATFDTEPYAIEGVGDVPTLQSLGYDITGSLTFFIIGRDGIDEAVVNKLYEAFDAAINDPKFQEFVEARDVSMKPRNPQELDEFVNTTYSLAEEMMQ